MTGTWQRLRFLVSGAPEQSSPRCSKRPLGTSHCTTILLEGSLMTRFLVPGMILSLMASLLPEPSLAAASNLRFVSSAEELPASVAGRVDALALIKVYPFKNQRAFIQCTGIHIGAGTVLTAGHCFLGAYRCNGAQVSFGIPGPRARRARCTQVLMTEAAGSAYNSSRFDYALFKVDNPPEVAVDIQPNTRQPSLDLATVLVGYPRLSKPRNREVLAISEGCALSNLSGADLFGRPRSQASVLHGCATVPGMNGGILFGVAPDGGDGGLVALQQAGSIEPEQGQNPLTLTSVHNVAQSLARLSPLQNYRPLGNVSGTVARRGLRNAEPQEAPHIISSPAEVRIGTHLAEAYPLGIAEALSVNIGQFAAAPGTSGRLKIAARVGAGSKLVIKDGSGQTTTLEGTSFFESTQMQTYASPVTLSTETEKGSPAFQATVRLEPDL